MSAHVRGEVHPPIKKILLLENDEPSIELLSQFLGRFYRVVPCQSGESAVKALCRIDDIDVIVTDLRMPGVNGFDVLRCAADHSRMTGRVIPAVVLTGHGTPEDEQHAMALGVKHFQRKPIDLAKLRKAIEGVVACFLLKASPKNPHFE